MASSSSSVDPGKVFEGVSPPYPSASASKPWDVFINHYGKEVKHTLAANIYDKLKRTGLLVFLDNKALEAGDIIPARIEEAMRSASLHIAIFSPNYARSPWCLQELSFMIQTSTKIIPVFYHVDPCDLRWVGKDKGIYASAFSDYQEKGRYTKEKLDQWKEALQRSSILSGHVVTDNFDEGRVLRDIANEVLRKMEKLPLDVAKHPVGLDSMVQELERCIARVSAESENKARIVGIVGVEGVGKTTLAKEVYNRNYLSFQDTSFIFNVRDAASKSDIHNKQKKLLVDFGNFKKKDLNFDNLEEGKTILGRRLRSKSALIVLDDVSEEDQLDALLPESARDQLIGRGNLIIVTCRELTVLTKWGIPSDAIYKMKGLDESDAQNLLCWHAFSQPRPKEGYQKDLVGELLIKCKGLPESLRKRGEDVKNRQTQQYHQSSLNINASDIEWETILPQHYQNILSQKGYSSKEEIYGALRNPIQIEEGEQIWLDQSTGKIGLKTSARSMTIAWGDDNKYWQWVSTEESSFGEVKELVEVWFFKVSQRLKYTPLSPNTMYRVAFVVKIQQSRKHCYQSPFVFSLRMTDGTFTKSARFLDDLEKPVENHGGLRKTPLKCAENGWMEFVVGEFFSGHANAVDVSIENDSDFPKSGIFLDGVKITPK